MNEVLNDLNAMRRNKHYKIWRPFLEKYNCQVICEIGVRFGVNFNKLIKHHPKEAVAIDIWHEEGVPSRNDKGYTQQQLDEQYENFKKDMADKPFVKIYREYSHEAVKHFPDEYFDFVYIDADHSYEGCLQDIKDWYPKVKKGGFLIGDDYKRNTTRTGVKFGVIKAIEEFTLKNNLSYFVFPPDKKCQWGIKKKTLLHIGCGTRYHRGFINSDKEEYFPTGEHKKVDMLMDIAKPWPYASKSVEGIISMCVFQCLNWVELYYALTEAYRVLKPGGVMRFGVVLEETKQPLSRFLYGRNIQIYNFELFKSVLIDRIRFSSIKLCEYRETLIPEFKVVDCRQDRGTSFIEVVK